jgi:hypothetical protein
MSINMRRTLTDITTLRPYTFTSWAWLEQLKAWEGI